MKNTIAFLYGQWLPNQNEFIYKSEVFVLNNIYTSPEFNVDTVSERNTFRFCIKRNNSQVKCCMVKKKKLTGTILAIKYLLLSVMIC